MNPAAHSFLSGVWIEAKASFTSAGSRPISGYMPFSARWMASVLISSSVRSAAKAVAHAPQLITKASKRILGEDVLNMGSYQSVVRCGDKEFKKGRT